MPVAMDGILGLEQGGHTRGVGWSCWHFLYFMCVDDMTSFRTVSVQSAQLVKEGADTPGRFSTFFSIIASHSPFLDF